MTLQSNSQPLPGRPQKKRLLFIITQSEMGGAQRFLITLLTALDTTRYEILVTAGKYRRSKTTGGDLLEILSTHGISTQRLQHLQREIRPVEDLRAILELKRTIRTFKPDTVFLSSSKAGFIGSLAARLSLHRRYNVIYRIGGWTFNDPWPTWKKRLWLFLEKISAPWKDVIMVNSRHDLEQAQQLGIKPKMSIALIHNGIDKKALEEKIMSRDQAVAFLRQRVPEFPLSPNKKIIGTIANFYPSKGLEYLIEAGQLLTQRDDWCIIIIGDGPDRRQIEGLIDDYHLNDRVLLTGQLNEAYQYASAFDLFVLPSVKEGFPWAILEAMAARVACIATNVGAAPEIINTETNGILVPPADSQALATRIQELLDDTTKRISLGDAGYQTLDSRFNLSLMLRETEQYL